MSGPNTQFIYAADFKKAMDFSIHELDPELTPNFHIDRSWGAPLRYGLNKASRKLEAFFGNGQNWHGNCFLATALVSTEFLLTGIPHAITIGYIELENGAQYMKTSHHSLMADIRLGFNPVLKNGVPICRDIDAHAWITLPNGEIVDATIVSWLNRYDGSQEKCGSDLTQWIYRSSITSEPRVVRHIPLLTGLSFHLMAVTGVQHEPIFIKEECYDFYRAWAEEYLTVARRSENGK